MPSAPLVGQVLLALLIGLFFGVSPATAAEAFPASVRCTGVGIAHNLTIALLGGTAPLVATYLIDKTDNEMIPPMYLMAAAAVTLLFSFTFKETAKIPLAD